MCNFKEIRFDPQIGIIFYFFYTLNISISLYLTSNNDYNKFPIIILLLCTLFVVANKLHFYRTNMFLNTLQVVYICCGEKGITNIFLCFRLVQI